MITLTLNADAATLESCGGKAVNLMRLARAGFRVPPGFIVVTDAYRAFIAANDLAGLLREAVADADPGDAVALESVSATIRKAFAEGRISAEVLDPLHAAWADAFTAETALAVRSSATAEDLPDLSFAGQQDTFLNVVGFEPVVRAVVDCWSSLWTARAIGYRMRNGIPHDGVALAVVVQQLVPSEVSGVLFTANPLIGTRTETVIDATFGLGEALVSGQVEPDHFVVDAGTGSITSRVVGAKAVATVSRPSGGVATLPQDDARPSLTDAQVAELVALGQRVQAEYGSPQDIEWALADGTLFVLQSRAITSLYPLPLPNWARARARPRSTYRKTYRHFTGPAVCPSRTPSVIGAMARGAVMSTLRSPPSKSSTAVEFLVYCKFSGCRSQRVGSWVAMSSRMQLRRTPRTGRRPGDSGTRAAILTAAREQFASNGYDGASLRVIAAAAGVDPGLIRHFYGSKDNLFEAALEIPQEISQRMVEAFTGDPDGLGERIVDGYLSLWEDPASAEALRAMVRSAISSDRAADRLRTMLTARFLAEIAPRMQQPDGEIRAGLAASHLMGLAVARFVVRVEPIAGLDRATLIAVSAPIVQGLLTGPLPPLR